MYFVDVIVLLAVATAGLIAGRALRLPPIVAYLVAGVLVGPGGLGLVSRSDAITQLAELGVALLLFGVGIEFSLERLRLILPRMVASGTLQVTATIAATAFVFRGLGDARSAGFLQSLDRHGATRGGKLALAAVSWLKDDKDPRLHLQAARDEATRLGLRFAALGLDPDFREKSLIRSFQVTALSATFLIFDPQGHLAWYQQDPREVDASLAIRIWDRIVGGH